MGETWTKRTQIRNSPWTPIRLDGRNDLERNCIPRDRRKVVIPNPLGDLLVARNADALMGAQHLFLLLCARGAEVFGETRADDQDVALAEGGPLVFGDFLESVERDGVPVEAVVLDALGLRVGAVVEEHATADEATTFLPV